MKALLYKKGFSLIELSIVVLIIGILVLGITQGSRMINNANINTARSITTNSTVRSIPDLALWLESSLENSIIGETSGAGNIPDDGEAISSWNDISGNGNNFSQSNASRRPIYNSSSIGNLPSINFDGVNDLLTTNLNISSAGYTIFIVFNINQVSTTQTLMRMYGSGGMYVSTMSNATMLFFHANSNGTNNQHYSVNTISSNTNYIATVDRGFNIGANMWINNSAFITNADANRNPFGSNVTANIGSYSPGLNPVDGSIS